MNTQANEAPEPEDSSSFLQDADQPSGSLMMAMIYGLATAIIGGMIWAAIVVVANYELGILAWAIGGCVGGVMVWAKKTGSTELAVAAVILSLVGLASGKLLSYEYGTLPDVQQAFEEDKSNVDYYIFNHLKRSGRFSKPLLAWVTSEESSEEPPEALREELDKLHGEAEALRNGTDRAFIKKEAAIHARNALASMTLSERYDLGGFDLLWIFLAVATAWRLGNRRSEPVRQRVRTAPTDPEAEEDTGSRDPD
jgi:hypothetical protein